MDSTNTPTWYWLNDLNSILFSTPIDSGKKIFISFFTDYFGLPKHYSLFNRQFYKENDLKNDTIEIKKRIFTLPDDDKINLTGYKSIGLSIGSFGQINIEQGLDINVSGEIRPETELNAHLSDQGSSLDGATKEISEFDLMFITLNDPNFQITAGDQYVHWIQNGISSANKKIKGLHASINKKNWFFGGFGALSGGKYCTEYIKGISGIQGPYSLSGNGENGFITPVGGTLKCRLNGENLTEGKDFDYIIDYELGSITFNPKKMIITNDLIKIEYEYKINDYQRFIYGVNAGYTTNDSLININGVLWSESDNRNRPIERTFSKEDLTLLNNAGDNTVTQSNINDAHEVHPNDVASEDALNALYKISTDYSGISFFKHIRFNRLKPDSSKGFYKVWFSYVGNGYGDYERKYSSYYKNYIYYYIGYGYGTYSTKISLETPKRKTSGEVLIQIKHSIFKADVSITGQELDKNLLSSIDDNNNLSSSGKINLFAGEKRIDKKSFWFNGKFQGSSKNFDGELISAWEKFNAWDDTSKANFNRELIWEAASGITFIPGISTQFIYGQNRNINYIDKINNKTNLEINNIKIEYDGFLLRNNLLNKNFNNRNEIIKTDLIFNNFVLGFLFKENWKKNVDGYGTGLIGGSAFYDFTPWSIKQQFVYEKLKNGFNNIFSANDSGYQFTWNQNIKKRIANMWDVEGSIKYYKQLLFQESKTSTFFFNFISNFQTKNNAFITSQEFSSTSERSSSFIIVPIYAGNGLGTHIYDSTRNSVDSTLDKFIPKVPGDWIIEKREITDNESSARMRKSTLNVNWTFNPRKNISGILADLIWEGTLFCEEYIDDEKTFLSSWIPGILSIKSIKNNDWFPFIIYSDCYYKQDIEWIHPQKKDINAQLILISSLKKIQTYKETSLETEFSINKIGESLKLRNKINYLTLFHDDSSSINYNIYNFGTEFLQNFAFKNYFNFYIQENIGICDEKDKKEKPFVFFEHIYSQLNPGVQFFLFEKGWTDISYTFSYVSTPNKYDYRLARGFDFGITHVFAITTDFKFGKYLSLNGMYRGEIKKEEVFFNRNIKNIFSMEMKALF